MGCFKHSFLRVLTSLSLSPLISNLCTFSLSLVGLEHELVKQTELSSSPFSSYVPFLSMLFNLNLIFFSRTRNDVSVRFPIKKYKSVKWGHQGYLPPWNVLRIKR